MENEYQKKLGPPCDSEEWFFKILGAPEYKYIWAEGRDLKKGKKEGARG